MKPTPVSPRPAFAGRVVGMISTAGVLAALVGVGYWGHETGWTFARGRPLAGDHGTDPSGVGLASVRPGSPATDPSGLPPGLRRPLSVVFDSAEAVDKAGIDIAPVWRAALTDAVAASGELSFDPTRVARVPTRAPGPAWRVFKTVGDPVKAGEVLALIDAADVGKAKAEYQQALVQVRLKAKALENLRPADVPVPEQRRREAEAAHKDAEARLLGAAQGLGNLGLTVPAAEYQPLPLDEVVRRMRLLGVAGDVPGLDAGTTTANLLPVRAPFDGVVLTADLVAGEMAEVGKPLFVVVDPRRLWLTLHVGSEDARRVAVGQPVRFRPDGLPDEVAGRVAWVGPAADETTRTVPVRAELPNDGGTLKAATLGRGRVVIREEADAVVVPHEAVQTLDGGPVVFVRDPAFLKTGGPKAFHVRAVKTGARDGPHTEVTAGLRSGEVVATKGSGLLLNELKRYLNDPAASR